MFRIAALGGDLKQNLVKSYLMPFSSLATCVGI